MCIYTYKHISHEFVKKNILKTTYSTFNICYLDTMGIVWIQGKWVWECRISPILIYILLMIFMSIITSIRNTVFWAFSHTLSYLFLKLLHIIKNNSSSHLFSAYYFHLFPHSSNIPLPLSWSSTQFELIITSYFIVKIETVM